MSVLPGMKTVPLALTALLLVSAVGLTAACEPGRADIHGTMLNEDGTPIGEGIVRAEQDGYPGVLLRADKDGHYSLANIYSGEWQLEFFDEDGWQVGLETCVVRADETATLNFTTGVHPLPEDFVRTRLLNVPAR